MTPEEVSNKLSQHDTDLSNQLTEIVELQRKVDTLESQVSELAAYKNQLDAVKADIEILIRFANPHLLGQVDNYILNRRSADPQLTAKCEEFLKRHPYKNP